MSTRTSDISTALDTAHDTERVLLRTTGTERCEPDYWIYRSERFTQFYDGNCLEVRDARHRDIGEWEQLYRTHFDQRYRHVTLFALEGSGAEQHFEEAKQRGYQLSHLRYLIAKNAAPVPALPAHLTIHTVDTEARWSMMAEFDDQQNRDASWYTLEGQAMLHERKRLISSAASIRWRYISPKSTDRILAKLGLFECESTHGYSCRLQDVVTAQSHRRQGLASVLLAESLQDACVGRASKRLYVCADADYFAIDLYRNLGFVDVGGLTRLFLPPA